MTTPDTKPRRDWHCGRPFGPTSLTVVATSRRDARRRYLEWLDEQGARRPRFVVIRKGLRAPRIYRDLAPVERWGQSQLDERIQCEQAHRDLGEDAGTCSCGQHNGSEQF